MPAFKYFLRNHEILPVAQAVVPLSLVEYAYGFGVYENIRVSKGKIFFIDEHCGRLMKSAEAIGLEHNVGIPELKNNLAKLVNANSAENCNIKIMLVGGRDAGSASLYALCLNPLYPDRKLYKTGAHAITYDYERFAPHAKTLNMLPSYLAYREAKRQGAYDALLIDREVNITEGTRTNFFAMNGKTIYSPPEEKILLGVTRDHVLKVAAQNGYQVVEQDLPLRDIRNYEAVFLTSTSSKIMPLRSIEDETWSDIASGLKDLMKAFNLFLDM